MVTVSKDMMKDSGWDDRPIDVSTEVNFIWSVATLLHSVSYKDADHRDVILPMTVLRRLECALAPTKEKVVKYAEAHPNAPEAVLKNKAGMEFFNKSPWTLEKLLSVKSQVRDLKDYIAGFSSNVAEIFRCLKFDVQIEEREKKNVLFGVITSFAEIDLSPATVDSVKMGYIFEDLMRKFYESAEAGKQYTGRDIIRLMVSVLLSEGADDIFKSSAVVTILDQACGTGGMLSSSFDYIRYRNPSAKVYLYGQEFDDAAYAICLAEMLIKGQTPDNIRLVDSLMTDCFDDKKMRFVIENPPFGTSWGGDKLEKREAAVKAENKKDGRYPAGLPGTGDSQLLFVQSAIDKLDERCGRAAIIEHAGPLYTGDAGSGESEIRRWLLRNDLLEAIIALPVDLFYNTGLQTYIWIISKNKSARRKGKVQLIDASSFFKPLRKPLGDKKNEISPQNREAITRLYADFKENEFVKIFDNEDFLYREYTVMRPKYDENGHPVRDRKGEIIYDTTTKDKEIVPWRESIEDYMAREVLPHIPDAKAFFLEDLTKKKPLVKTGAAFPFTRYFYNYAELESSAKIWNEIKSTDNAITEVMGVIEGNLNITHIVTRGLPGRHHVLRSSGLPWLGDVPATWEISPLYKYVQHVKRRNEGMVEKNLLSLSYGRIIRKDIETATGLVPSSYEGYNRIEAGDIVLRLTDLQNDQRSLRVGLCREQGIVTSAYVTIRPLDRCCPAYLAYALKVFDFRKGFYRIGSGVRQSLTFDEIKRLKFPFPSITEQEEIVAYLDRMSLRIDSVIAQHKSLLEKFEILKRALIGELVPGKREVCQ